MARQSPLSFLSTRICDFMLYEILFFIRLPVVNACIRHVLRYLNPKKDVLLNIQSHKIYANTIDRILAIYFWGFLHFEKFEHDLIANIVKDGMRVVDIGANLGYHTLQLAECVGTNGEVYAFEPDPDNYRLLVKNLEVNQYKNVVTVPKAASHRSGIASLYISEENKGDHRIYDAQEHRKSIEIETVALDDFFCDKGSIDFIKVDVQGSECLVLEGMNELINKNSNLSMICEFAPAWLEQCGFSGQDLLNKIRSFGFKIYNINGGRQRLDPVEDDKLISQYKGGGYTNLYLTKGNGDICC